MPHLRHTQHRKSCSLSKALGIQFIAQTQALLSLSLCCLVLPFLMKKIPPPHTAFSRLYPPRKYNTMMSNSTRSKINGSEYSMPLCLVSFLFVYTIYIYYHILKPSRKSTNHKSWVHKQQIQMVIVNIVSAHSARHRYNVTGFSMVCSWNILYRSCAPSFVSETIAFSPATCSINPNLF